MGCGCGKRSELRRQRREERLKALAGKPEDQQAAKQSATQQQAAQAK